MKITRIEPPRAFRVGKGASIEILDCARIGLDADEQVTFVTAAGGEYDVVRKAWGFYATPSLNGRLRDFGLRAVLARNAVGRFYLYLVERGHERTFDDYAANEEQTIVAWLDSDDAVQSLERKVRGPADASRGDAQCLCGGSRVTLLFTYDAPPDGEIRFRFSATERYRRQLLRCELCGHFLSVHGMDASRLYAGDYVTSNYGDDGLAEAFARIIALPPAKSDNTARVARVLEFARKRFGTRRTPSAPSVLDVGSGLCVFLYCMKAAGWRCTALDPDPRAIAHARNRVGVDAVYSDFKEVTGLGRFDVVTFNKVLEHVEDPITMLAHSRDDVAAGGFVYVELPDGEAAIGDGPSREEFYIDHPHAFSVTSATLLATRAGLRVIELERLREASGKYTLRLFLDVP